MVSSKDVAKLAGVSQATVSRVLNGSSRVDPNTRDRVRKAIEQLQYYPNLIARSLITRSTRTIALISGTLKNGFFVETTDAIVQYATRRGYRTMVYFQEENLEDIFEHVVGSKASGLLLSSIQLDDPLYEKIVASRIPCVFFNRKPREGGHYVIFDNERAAELVADHLLGLGHRRIAYLSGSTRVSTFNDRMRGFEKALRRAKVQVDPELVCMVDPTRTEEVEHAVRKLLLAADPPSAIFCSTDMLALLCMDIAASMGFRIPDDVSVAGIDNIRIAAHPFIRLTSAGHAKFNLGEIAVEQLIELIEQQEGVRENAQQNFRQIVLQPELFVRNTTKPRN
jgi:LacI family transcriptional regulator